MHSPILTYSQPILNLLLTLTHLYPTLHYPIPDLLLLLTYPTPSLQFIESRPPSSQSPPNLPLPLPLPPSTLSYPSSTLIHLYPTLPDPYSASNLGPPPRSYGTSYHPPSYPQQQQQQLQQHANLSQLGLYANTLNAVSGSSLASLPSSNSINNSVLTEHFPESQDLKSGSGPGLDGQGQGQGQGLVRKPSMSLSVNSMQSESDFTTASPMVHP